MSGNLFVLWEKSAEDKGIFLITDCRTAWNIRYIDISWVFLKKITIHSVSKYAGIRSMIENVCILNLGRIGAVLADTDFYK